MMVLGLCLLVFVLLVSSSSGGKIPCDGDYVVKKFSQRLDHFSFQSSEEFSQRYIVCDKFVDPSKDDTPVFLYTGNEGEIWTFFNNTGFTFEFAEEIGALVVFIEHRYYGESVPVRHHSDADDYSKLGVDQTLADYIELIKVVRDEYKLGERSATIAFGGSYGGMLAAWIRMKYPNIIDGSLAASAPVLQFEGQVSPYSYNEVITNVFNNIIKHDPGCDEIIKNGFISLNDLISKKEFSTIQSKFKTCQPISTSEDAWKIYYVFINALNGLSYANYPTENTFLRRVPAWCVEYTCNNVIKSSADPLLALTEISNVYYNYTGDQSCFDIDWTFSPGIADKEWDFQACTEMIMPIGANGKTDMFLPEPWVLEEYLESCKGMFKSIVPQVDRIPLYFHNTHIGSQWSNIIFSNGKLDPWRAGGVFDENIFSETIYSIDIVNGAHHVDLRFASKDDPQTIRDARNLERKYINEWIAEKKKQ